MTLFPEISELATASNKGKYPGTPEQPGFHRIQKNIGLCFFI
jgi:hypothetical protein